MTTGEIISLIALPMVIIIALAFTVGYVLGNIDKAVGADGAHRERRT